MEFRQLEYFYTISKLENFTRTAEVLHVSQPSVTKAIKALESELQLTLIDRRQKHVTLTQEGKAFLLHAEKILRDIEETQQDMQRFKTNTKATIYFGIPPMVEAYLFPDFFTKFKISNPQLNLELREYNDSSEVRRRADEGELDFGIVLGDDVMQNANEMLIMKDHMSLCLYPGHPLAEADRIHIGQLKNEKFIMQQPYTYQYRSVFERCEQQGFTPDVVLCATQLKTNKQLVENKMGISILPDFVTRNDKNIVRKQLRPPFIFHVCLVWCSDKKLSDIDRAFVNFMRQYISTREFKENFRQR